MMAFIIIKALKLTGFLDILSLVFGPLISLFGVPGEATAVLMSAIMSMGSTVGVTTGLASEGILQASDIAILAPAICLIGFTIQYAGRILGVVETDGRRYPIIFAICIINALLSMWVMNILV